jgi:hypothetical protein
MGDAQIIRVYIDRKACRLRVEKIYESNQVVRYKVSGRNRSIVMQTNEPFFRNRGMKHRRPDWKIWEGQMHQRGFLGLLIKELEYMRQREAKQARGY